MATLIADLDGTVFYYGTDKFLPGALETLLKFNKVKDNDLVFITARWEDGVFSMRTKDLLESHFGETPIVWGVSSPRILINDEGAKAINHPQDEGWDYKFKN